MNFLFFYRIILLQLVPLWIALSKGKNIDYQIHSNNDLREWNQLLLKGARRFKVDPHYLKNEECNGLGHTDDKSGCLLLNHDIPMPAVGVYNSTADLLDYITSDFFHQYVGAEYVSIAVCFKSAPDWCDESSAAFMDWLALVDEFHEDALARLPPNTEIILDGDGKPKDCIVGRWLPWNSVWINTESPQAAFTSNDEAVRIARPHASQLPECCQCPSHARYDQSIRTYALSYLLG